MPPIYSGQGQGFLVKMKGLSIIEGGKALLFIGMYIWNW